MEKEGSIEHILGICMVCKHPCCNCKDCVKRKGKEDICLACYIIRERERGLEREK
jgi:hypothetical protein